MTFEKEIAVALEVERVWAFLWDVERVARCLPGCREARAIVPPILAPTRWKRRLSSLSIRPMKSSISRSSVHGKSRGIAVEAPKPRISGRTTR